MKNWTKQKERQADLAVPEVKAIIFDCFGVFYVEPFSAFIHSFSSPEIRQSLLDVLMDYQIGKISKADLLKEYSRLSGQDGHVVEQRLFAGSLVRDDVLLKYSQQLRKKYKIGLLSNASPGVMDQFFAQKERQEYFDAVVVSCEVDLMKPWPEIFLLAVRRLGVKPSQAVFIDDSEANCQGARNAGMKAILYQGMNRLRGSLDDMLI